MHLTIYQFPSRIWKNIGLVVSILVFILNPILSKPLRNISDKASSKKAVQRKKIIIARFVRAGVWEGKISLTFVDAGEHEIYFDFDKVQDQDLPYNFLDENANTNATLQNSLFEITYVERKEFRGEPLTAEKTLV
ncbi:MAG: hypothetical protein K8R21_04100, partial [Leptospira sp.]|nr:hypothetical protein [Leptospira sp.]